MRRIGQGFRRGATALLLLGMIAAMAGRAGAQSESWDAVYISGSKVGHMRIRVNPVKDGDRSLVRVLVDINLSFKRGKDASTIELQYGTIETPEGQVLRLDTRTLASKQVLRVHGDVIDGKMTLRIENGDQKQEQVIPWGTDVFGPYGAELSLSKSPMKPGEVRKIRTFIPDLNKIADATLTARAKEPIALGGGSSRDLLRVDQEYTIDGRKSPEMSTTLWVDDGGQILKSFTDANGGMVTYRTTREAATRQSAPFDLLAASIVKLPRKINNPEGTRDVVYKVTLSDGEPAQVFPIDRRQTIKAGADATSATLQVRTAGPDAGPAGPETVGPEYLRANALINSEDPRVIILARRAVGTAVDPWAKAQAINHWVAQNLRKNFETGFASAEEVARTLQGDCTEHGVLTAAMCRAEGVPARVVVGLVYAADHGGFGFHMWDEVYVNRRWVAIDSAFDESQVDATHLKLSETSLDGVAPFETFLSVARVSSKLKLEAVEVR